MYENTNTILNILSQNREKKSGLPILNLTFDGNRNEIDEAKIHSFIYYAFEEKMTRKSEPRREA